MKQHPLRHLGTSTLLLLLAACSPSEPGSQSAPGPTAPPISAASPERSTRTPENRGADRSDRVSLSGRRVPRAELLRRLSQQAGFRLVGAAPPARTLTLELRDVEIHAALSALLADVSFRTHFTYDPKTERHRLTVVEVRPVVTAPGLAAPAPTPAPTPTPGRAASLATPEDPREIEGDDPSLVDFAARDLEDARNRRDEIADELASVERWGRESGRNETLDYEQRVSQLEDSLAAEEDSLEVLQEFSDEIQKPSADAHIDALQELDPSDRAGLQQLQNAAQFGSDDATRIAAIEMLGEADSYGSTDTLLGLLGEEDPAILVATLRALEWGDPSILDKLEPLADHPDPEVRQALDETKFVIGD